MPSRVLWGWVLAIAACGRSGANDLPAATATDRGSPVGLALPGDANGAWWDPTRGLVLADDTHDRLVVWTGHGFNAIAGLPRSAALGGIVGLRDGRYVVTAFGFGTDGAVYVIDGEQAAAVPGLDPARRRTGLAVAPDGTLYVAYFVAGAGAAPTGGIARLDLAGHEHDVVTGLGKPVGIAATSAALFVSDQHRSTLVTYARQDPGPPTVIASALAEPDLLTVLPDGDLVVGSRTGVVYRVTPAGDPVVIARGYEQVRGTAYDPATRRLFVVEHAVASDRHQLHIVQVE